MTAQTSTVAATGASAMWRYWSALGGLIAAYWFAAAVYRPWQTADPDLPTAHSRLAGDLARVGRLPEAIEQGRAALALRPDDVLARYNVAVFLRQSGKNAEAEFELAELIQRAPKFSPAQVLRGTILAERGDVAGAVQAWQAAGDHPAAQENLRRLRARQPAK